MVMDISTGARAIPGERIHMMLVSDIHRVSTLCVPPNEIERLSPPILVFSLTGPKFFPVTAIVIIPVPGPFTLDIA